MEIERKFLPASLPNDLSAYPHKRFTQGYLSVEPVVRVRREGNAFFLTYKSAGLMAREEYNLPLTEEAYLHLIKKADGIVIEKTRYLLPMTEEGDLLPAKEHFDEGFLAELHARGLLVELDVFDGSLAPLVMAEVEFPTEDAANAFLPPVWLGRDVTNDRAFHNSVLSREGLPPSVTTR